MPSLYLLYLGYTALEPLVAISSLTAFGSVLLFVFIVFTRADAIATAPGAALAGSPLRLALRWYPSRAPPDRPSAR